MPNDCLSSNFEWVGVGRAATKIYRQALIVPELPTNDDRVLTNDDRLPTNDDRVPTKSDDWKTSVYRQAIELLAVEAKVRMGCDTPKASDASIRQIDRSVTKEIIKLEKVQLR